MYKCYDGQLLLLFDYQPEFIERDTSTMTEQNYVDRDRQIQSFIRSGERLQVARSAEFEFPDDVVPSDVKVDPTTVLGFDLSDAFLLSQELQDRIAAAKSRKEKGVEGEEPSAPSKSDDKVEE